MVRGDEREECRVLMEWSRIADALYDGRDEEVAALTQEALEEGHSAHEVLNEGLLLGMDRVARDFEAQVIFVPEVLISAEAMQAGMEVLRPLLAESEGSRLGTFVVGTVHGDIHDIGKNLLCIMLEGAGIEVIDLGKDTPPQKFVEATREHEPQVVMMSALLTTTMMEMQKTIQALEKAGLREKVQVVIGGAPVSEQYAQQIGADGYAEDAVEAVALAKELLNEWLYA
jgi:5-methyltetrahydrofolate--homocysteine methyltransferase